MSALLIARGIAGPTGKIVMGDSEAKRGSLYADVIPGGFETFDLCEPFSPARYIEAIDTIEESGADVGIIDSGSHEWEGAAGVLDAAMENESRSGKSGLHNWKTPKLEHAKFVQRLLRTRIPFIVCLRAKHKSRQVKDDRGKTVIVKDDFTSPIQADDFIFEATCHAEVMPDHTIRLTKCSHPGLRDCFPEDFKEPLNIKHGEAIAKWAAGGKVSGPQVQPVDAEMKALKKRLNDRARGHFANAAGGLDVARFTEDMKKESILAPDEELSSLSIERMREVVTAVEEKLDALF